MTSSCRTVFTGGPGAAALTLAACGNRTTPTEAGTFAPPPSLTPKAVQDVVTQTLTAAPTTVDLGGKTVSTWAYGEALPGPLIRATAGDLLRITLVNRLPETSTIHWHGIRLHNAVDGVPGMTQDRRQAGSILHLRVRRSALDTGWNDEQLTERSVHVALNLFTKYFNHFVQTDLDLPAAPAL